MKFFKNGCNGRGRGGGHGHGKFLLKLGGGGEPGMARGGAVLVL